MGTAENKIEIQFGVILDSLKAGFDNAVSSVKESTSHLSGSISQMSAETKSATDDMAQSITSSITSIAVKVAAGLGLYKLTEEIGAFIKDSAMLASRVETLGVVLDVVGKNAGYTSIQMQGFVDGVKKMGITTQESIQTIIRMAQAHLDLRNSTQLARVAQDVAVIGNINSSEALNRLLHGITTLQPEVLRNIGITVLFEAEYRKFAATVGKTAETLTQNEKQQIALNTVLREGEKISGSYEVSMGTAGKQILSMSRYVEEIKLKFGEFFQEMLSGAVFAIVGILKDVDHNIGKLKTSMDDLWKILSAFPSGVLGFFRSLEIEEGRLNQSTLVLHKTLAEITPWQQFWGFLGKTGYDIVDVAKLFTNALSLLVMDSIALLKLLGGAFYNLSEIMAGYLTLDLDKVNKGMENFKTTSVDAIKEIMNNWRAFTSTEINKIIDKPKLTLEQINKEIAEQVKLITALNSQPKPLIWDGNLMGTEISKATEKLRVLLDMQADAKTVPPKSPGTEPEKTKSSMPKWDAELEDDKVKYAKLRESQGSWSQWSAEDDVKFWSQKLLTAKKGTDEYTSVMSKLNAATLGLNKDRISLEKEGLNEIAKDNSKSFEERLQAYITMAQKETGETLQAQMKRAVIFRDIEKLIQGEQKKTFDMEIEALKRQATNTKKSYDTRLDAYLEMLKKEDGLSDESKKRIQAVLVEIEKLQEGHQATMLEIDQLLADREKDIADAQIEMKREMIRREEDIKKITKLQALQAEKQLLDEQYNIELKAINAKLDAQKKGNDKELKEFERLLNEKKKLEIKYNADVAKMTIAMMKEQGHTADEYRKKVLSTVKEYTSMFGSAIQGLLTKTMTWAQALQNIMSNLLTKLIDFILNLAAEWITTLITGQAATSTAAAATIATNVTEALSYAAVGTTAAGASVAAIPFVGWSMVPGVMAETGGLLYGMAAMASAAGGYDIPYGVNPIVQTHAEEMILPAHLSNKIRALTEAPQYAPHNMTGGDYQGTGRRNNTGRSLKVEINALDSKDVYRVLKNNNSSLSKVLKKMGNENRFGRFRHD